MSQAVHDPRWVGATCAERRDVRPAICDRPLAVLTTQEYFVTLGTVPVPHCVLLTVSQYDGDWLTLLSARLSILQSAS